MFNILRCSACCRPSRAQITSNKFSTIFEALVPHFYLRCTHCIVPESLLSHLNSFCGGMFKLNTKFGADPLLYWLSHFECDCDTVHMVTQWPLPPPLTGSVKSSLLTHVHSSPLSLAPGYIHVAQTVLILTSGKTSGTYNWLRKIVYQVARGLVGWTLLYVLLYLLSVVLCT